MAIRALYLLPPLAIGRLGSGSLLESYTVEVDDDRPLDFRSIVPTPTFTVDESTGEICAAVTPTSISFTDGGRVKKVAPFLELFAEVEGHDELQPVTPELVASLGGRADAVAWRVAVGNRKVSRRTGDAGDAVAASVGWFSDHDAHPLNGTSPNFVDGAAIPFGSVRFIRPNADHPEIRLRFTPADGAIYGCAGVDPDDPVPAARVYDPGKGGWHGWWIPVDADGEEQPGSGTAFLNETLPPSLFAIVPPAPPWLHGNIARSRGYFDDTCDGIVDVRLTLPSGSLTASARITSGPPALVPDAFFVRSLADDLEQAIAGPTVEADEPPEVTMRRAEEIVRRAFETVRFMNVAVMNGEDVQGRPALAFDTMPAEEAFDTERLMRPVMAGGSVDTLSVMALHQHVYAALRGGAAPWFARLLRRPDAVGDFTDDGRRRMPALMCGADGSYLALTHRQIDTIERAAVMPAQARAEAAAAGTEPPARLTARNRTAQMRHVAAGTPFSSSPATAIANCCPGLEVDFRAVWRRVLEGITLREYDNLVMESTLEGPGADLVGHRLLRVGGMPTMAQMVGPSPADPAQAVVLATEGNPDAVTPLEWSNAFARVLADHQGGTVVCDFSADALWEEQCWFDPVSPPAMITIDLPVRRFFEADSAFISRVLAEPGELTQGLCSPWQNDFRECSCYYWASARPDFVNVETTPDGRSAGDNWLQKERTGAYIADDYVDRRLVLYDDLMGDWETWLRFQIRGRDAPREHRG